MQKSKKSGVATALRPVFLSEAEQELLSHVEMCYSVALTLTRDPVLGQRLARATLLWAWQRQARMGASADGDIKRTLLKELRRRFLNEFHTSYVGCSAG